MCIRLEEIVLVANGWLAVVLDLPAAPPRGLVVMCHGLTGDHSGPQRLLTDLAKALSKANFVVVRFDFRGSGDSSGTFSETTFASMQEDLETIVSWIVPQYSELPLALAGLSIGGVAPALVAPRHKECHAVVLLSSDLIEGVQFDVSGPVEIRGGQFILPASFFRDREPLLPRSTLANAAIPTCMFYGERDGKLARAAAEMTDLGFSITCLIGVDHLFEDITQRRILSEGVIAFLNSHLRFSREDAH